MHLERIEGLAAQGVVVYAEPDLLAEITDTACVATFPNDPKFGEQENLPLQKVDAAWAFLATIPGADQFGSPDVFVATFDTGVELTHPDIVGSLSDGTDPVAQCFDFEQMRRCDDAGYAPDGYHGTAVYGIITARTNNCLHVAGIAPNTHQIVIKRLDVDSVVYKDILLWIAGFATGNQQRNLPQDWPAEPIARGADIINCSHIAKNLALSGLMDNTLTHLTSFGRGGRGTVVVYGAGNADACITGTSTWAAHPSTLAVANSKKLNLDLVEERHDTSNWGRELDLCARGARVWSLNHISDVMEFDGTSAAAPTVSAAAALLLSANPNLTWNEVRQILCDTAEEIDTGTANTVGAWSVGFSQWYGHGRLNVCEAVKEAHARLS